MKKVTYIDSRNGQIIWISSYPKAGNTWVRFLLMNLLYGKQTSSKNFQFLIPDIHEINNLSELSFHLLTRQIILIKTHFLLTDQFPYLNRTIGYIYIVRHPIDLMLSNWNYYSLSIYNTLKLNRENYHHLFNQYVESFIQNQGTRQWKYLGFGNFPENVSSWVENSYDIPRLIIKYEDLNKDPYTEVKNICCFLGLELEEQVINQAIINSNFSEMRKLEEQEIKLKQSGFFYDPDLQQSFNQGLRFVSGKTQELKKLLSADQINRAKDAFATVMELLNYE